MEGQGATTTTLLLLLLWEAHELLLLRCHLHAATTQLLLLWGHLHALHALWLRLPSCGQPLLQRAGSRRWLLLQEQLLLLRLLLLLLEGRLLPWGRLLLLLLGHSAIVYRLELLLCVSCERRGGRMK